MSDSFTGFCDPIPYTGLSCSNLIQNEVFYLNYNLIFHALSIPMRGWSFSELKQRKLGRQGGGGERDARKRN